MDELYEQSLNYLLGLMPVQDWPEMHSLLQRAYAGKPRQWELPVLAGQAAGARPEALSAAVAAFACSQISILLLDDLLDDDARGEHQRVGAAAAANLASAFQAAGLEAVARSALEPERKASVLQLLNQMVLLTAAGQYLDVQAPGNEDAYWRIVRTKSSPYFGTAMQIGALFAGAPEEVCSQLRRFGDLYGEMIQIHDDLMDSLSVPASPDWTQGRSPLPILFAQVVQHPERQRFMELRRGELGLEHLEEAQGILVHCGAVSYCIDQIFQRYHKAVRLLRAVPLQDGTGLQTLLDRLVKPVVNLYVTLGWDYSGLLLSFEISSEKLSGEMMPN